MRNELQAASRGYDLAQIERDWTMAQARIDALAEAGMQAIQRLLQDTLERAERAEPTPNTTAALDDLRRVAVTGNGHHVIMPGLCRVQMIKWWPRAIA